MLLAMFYLSVDLAGVILVNKEVLLPYHLVAVVSIPLPSLYIFARTSLRKFMGINMQGRLFGLLFSLSLFYYAVLLAD